MVQPPSRRAVIASSGLLAASLAGCLSSGEESEEESSTTNPERSLEWGGQGDEFATLECEPDEVGFWKWVLTPGGQPQLEEEDATLTVFFADGTETTADGFRPGEGGGALQFEVFKDGGGTVEDAEVQFNGGGNNPVLTISEAECREDEDEDPALDVETQPATDVNESTATLNGELTDIGTFEEVSVFFEFRAVGDEEFQETEPQTLTEPGSFSAELDGLEAGDVFEFRAVATANDLRVVGATLSFEKEEPDEEAPAVETQPATDVNESTATLNGELTDLGTFEEVSVFFEFRPITDEEFQTTEPQTLTEPGTFSAELDGLEAGDEFEFRAVATANDQQVTGEIETFEKEEPPKKERPKPKADLSLEAVCYDKTKRDPKYKFQITNTSKHDLTTDWETDDGVHADTVTVPSDGKTTFWVTSEQPPTVTLSFDGEAIDTAAAETDRQCP